MDEFIKWTTTHKIQLHQKLQIIQQDHHQHSIRLSKNESFIPKSTIIASIPKSICLSHQTSSLKHSNNQSKCECECDISKSSSLILTKHLLHEIKLKKQSQWSAYLSIILPSSTRPRPRLISIIQPELIQEYFKGTEIEKCLKSDLTIKYESLLHFYQFHLNPQPNQSTKAVQVEWQTFLDAYSIVSSRAFYIDNFHTLALVPIADLFDHSDLPDVNLISDIWVCDQCGSLDECKVHESNSHQITKHQETFQDIMNDQDRLELKTLVTIEHSSGTSDRIVYNSYGSKLGNHKLFIEYGFIIPENIHDRISFDLEEILKILDLNLDSDQIQILQQRIKFIKLQLLNSITEIDENELIRFEEEDREEDEDHHDPLYIDSSARVSLSLWITILLLDITVQSSRNLNDDEILDLIENLINFQLQNSFNLDNTFKSLSVELSKNIQNLCDSRLTRMFGNRLSLDELLNLKQDDLIPLLDKSHQSIIIDYLVGERLLLQSCKTRWIELNNTDQPSSLS